MRLSNRLIAQTAEMGALPILYAAAAPGLAGGAYVGPAGRGESRGYPTLVRASDQAQDTGAAQCLWQVSEQLAGVSYDLRSPRGA
jgi:hypothetical protein